MTDLKDGQRYMTISMDGARIKEVAQPAMEALNAQIRDGSATIDELLMALAYMLGASMAGRGIVLDLKAPIGQAIPPLLAGYKAKQAERAGG